MEDVAWIPEARQRPRQSTSSGSTHWNQPQEWQESRQYIPEATFYPRATVIPPPQQDVRNTSSTQRHWSSPNVEALFSQQAWSQSTHAWPNPSQSGPIWPDPSQQSSWTSREQEEMRFREQIPRQHIHDLMAKVNKYWDPYDELAYRNAVAEMDWMKRIDKVDYD